MKPPVLGWSVNVSYLKVKVGLGEVLVQSGRQVLRCGQDDAAHRQFMCYLMQLQTAMRSNTDTHTHTLM